jgi:hypothetical protein
LPVLERVTLPERLLFAISLAVVAAFACERRATT